MAQSGCLRKKHNKQSGALARRFPSGCAQKAIACVASLTKVRTLATGALASELFKRNASSKGASTAPAQPAYIFHCNASMTVRGGP